MSKYKSLRVLSFNILWNTTNFDERFLNMVNELRVVKPDVIFFQEVNSQIIEFITETFESLGYRYSNAGETMPVGRDPEQSFGNVTFSRFPIKESSQIAFPLIRTQQNLIPVPVTVIEYEGRDWHLLNAHLCWGGWEELTRMHQVNNLTQYAAKVKAKSPDSVVILGGDFNAQENHDSIRLLRGEAQPLSVNTGSVPLPHDCWTDAWKACGANERLATTSDPKTYWGIDTGRNNGIHIPELVPERRIDYLFSYGWNFGKIASPVDFGRFCDTIADTPGAVSDHFGIWADFLASVDSN